MTHMPGQTGRPFRVRFHEYYSDYKYANNKSKFAQHVIDEGHAFGPMIDIMDIVHIEKKSQNVKHTQEILYL